MKTFKQYLVEMVPCNVSIVSDQDVKVLARSIFGYLDSETETAKGTRLQQVNKAKSQLDTFMKTLIKLIGVE